MKNAKYWGCLLLLASTLTVQAQTIITDGSTQTTPESRRQGIWYANNAHLVLDQYTVGSSPNLNTDSELYQYLEGNITAKDGFVVPNQKTGVLQVSTDNEVLLEDGFTAEAGADFTAETISVKANNSRTTTPKKAEPKEGLNALNDALKVFPNPSNGIMALQLPTSMRRLDTQGATYVEVLSLDGKHVYKEKLDKLSNQSITLNIEHLRLKGIYILRVYNQQVEYARRIEMR